MGLFSIINFFIIYCNFSKHLFSDGFLINLNYNNNLNKLNSQRHFPLSKRYHEEGLKRVNQNKYQNTDLEKNKNNRRSYYPLSRKYYEDNIKRLNSKNITLQNESILGYLNSEKLTIEDFLKGLENKNTTEDDTNEDGNTFEIEIKSNPRHRSRSIFIDPISGITFEFEGRPLSPDDTPEGEFEEDDKTGRRRYVERENSKSKNFEVIKNYNIKFKDVGGYDIVKQELFQCVDILRNYQKYLKYNVRIPKGLILEGPPGTGKTLLAKGLAGESGCSFIPVSGSDFQEKYVGVGSSRIKELFQLAKKNVPCIIFIDEIDAVGRKRSSDGETSSSERDNTLNSLLVELDGFKNNTGVFLVAATNRIDLLDSALTRPGRIDKKIYIGLPSKETREAIINIHIRGKPYTNTVVIKDLVEITEGLSGAQIENLLNEAMLNALRQNRTEFSYKDFDLVLNKMMVGWQPTDHEFTTDIIDHIAIHEMGHAIVGILSKYHSKMTKVVINLSSPKSPGYTVFEASNSNIYIREALFEHLMILLSGRIAEEVFYGISVTTGAINDFEEALKLAEKMIIYYGMGKNLIYPSSSEKYKELIDTEVIELINNAYSYAEVIIRNSKDLIFETSQILKQEKLLKAITIHELINTKYPQLLELKS
jgi:cell division protease FtsH